MNNFFLIKRKNGYVRNIYLLKFFLVMKIDLDGL